jgi:hypothetical protein
MRALLLVLALLLAAPRQDNPDLLKSCEALFDRLTSLNAEDRAKAHAELVKLVSGKRDLLKTPVLPSAQITLAMVGDAAAAKEVIKILAEEPAAGTRAAAEAIGHAGPDGAADRLFKLLENDDLKLAMAAARSLSRAKGAATARSLQQAADRVENPRRKVLAHYALELNERGHLPTLLAQAESTQQPVREAAWAALANLPSAVDEIRKRLLEKDADAGYRTAFEGQIVSDEVRDVFGRLMVQTGIYVGPDLVELAGHKVKEVAAWARRAAGDPALLRKCVLIASLIQRLGTFEKETDEKKEPIPALEALLGDAGVKAEGEKLKDRLEGYRAAWERMRPSVLDKDVNLAIDAGAALLRSRQSPDGSWKFCVCGLQKNDAHANGTTALAIYTLLKCDVPVRDKAVTSGFDWLLAQNLPNHTYTVSLQAMALAEAVEMLTPPPKAKVKIPPDDLAALSKYIPRLRDCATWLVESQTHASRNGYECGDWDYQKPPQQNMDNSNTQFAVLGLRAAQNAGVPAPVVTWARSLNHWVVDQNKDGSWPYRKEKNNVNQAGSRSMTAAGLYCSLVAKASLKRKDPVTLVAEDPFKKGLEHFKKNYPVPALARDRSPGHVFSPYYDLYSLERAMMISKTEKLADRDWYRDGALFILANQALAGEWIDTTDTCFALLFLKKAFVAVATGDNK